jgi:WD40 repeat protein
MYSVDDFTGSRPSWILPIPGRGITAASADSNLLALKHRTHLDIWSLNHPTIKVASGTPLSVDQSKIGCSLSCRIQLKEGVSRDYFHSIALTNDGELLAATGGSAIESDNLDSLSGLRLWHLTRKANSPDCDITAVKLQLSTAILELLAEDVMCQSLAFSSDGCSLCVTISGADAVKLVLLDIEKPNRHNGHQHHVSVRHVINHSRQVKARGGQRASGSNKGSDLSEKLSMSVSTLSYSADGQWLAVCSSDKLVFIYEIDRLTLHWALPAFDSPVSCLAFHPQSPNSIIVVLSGDNSFQIFDVNEKTLTPWSLENRELIPAWATSLGKAASGPVMNISFDPSCASSFVMHGQAFSVYINLDRPIPSPQDSKQSAAGATTGGTLGAATAMNFAPQVVTHSMLAATEPVTKASLIQREMDDLLATDRNFRKKRKKLQRLLDEELSQQQQVVVANGGSEAADSHQTKKSKRAQSKSNGGPTVAVSEEVNGTDNEIRNFSILKSHRSIVHLSLLNTNEMVRTHPPLSPPDSSQVVVENPWVKILESLPDTLARKRYGAA